MGLVNITLPDGSAKEYNQGVTALEIAAAIGSRLKEAAVAVRINGRLTNLTEPIVEDSKVEIVTSDSEEGRELLRHSTAHLLAHAVYRLFPEAKPAIGPVIENGFYYDFDFRPFAPEDLEKIEAEMKNIVNEKLSIKRLELTRAEAKKLFNKNTYKLELIEKAEEPLTIYKQGEFIDLCRGPHVPNTSKLKAFKLLKTSGAYWRGDAKNKQLYRIYGTAFADKKQLKEYLRLIEEAKKRDHRKIGHDLDLFSFHDVSPGSPFFHPKGTVIYNELVSFLRKEYKKRGYKEVITPLIFNKSLWEKSGHWEHYKENMYLTKMDDKDFSLKPMNCPSHCVLYANDIKSYRELPLRYADFGVLHRHEVSGALGGLMRVRKFSQDDAHIFVTPGQITEEVGKVIDFIDYIYTKVFDFTYHVELSTKPEKAMGDSKLWEVAESSLAEALEKKEIKFRINEGDGAFYGPKIDFHIKDAIGRTWQCATIQLDFQMPERFGLTYDGEDGKKHTPVMIHRAILGSIERFMGVIIEHYAGKFPLWLSPEQVVILTIADRHITYAKEISEALSKDGFRVALDSRTESTPKKVREAQLKKIPYILVIGDKELENRTINIRTRDNIVHGEKKLSEFISELKEEMNKY